MNLHKLHLELLCYIGDVNKSKPVNEKEKLYTSKGTNIIYFGGKHFASQLGLHWYKVMQTKAS